MLRRGMLGGDGQKCCASVMKGTGVGHSTDNRCWRAKFRKGWPIDVRLELRNRDAREDADDEFALQSTYKAILFEAQVKVLWLAAQDNR